MKPITTKSTGDEWIDFIEGQEDEIIKRYYLFPELAEVTETLLKWIIGERQYVYDGFITDDYQELAEYDEVINKAQAVINKVKLEAK